MLPVTILICILGDTLAYCLFYLGVRWNFYWLMCRLLIRFKRQL